jgi:hypothetical protein
MRHIPSNRMPSYEEPRLSFVGSLVLVAILSSCALLIWIEPWAVLAVVAISIVLTLVDKCWRTRMANSRQHESLCTFARNFDCRAIDTWIIRAVYEQIQPLVGFPLRKWDTLRADLRLDGDDLSCLAEEIAARTGRPLHGTEKNPWFGRVDTVADLVSFFSCQSKRISTPSQMKSAAAGDD